MRIKKYIVNSIPDAMQLIRKDLGNDAIILNTKKIKIGGFLGLFAKQQIEVIATVDQEKKTKNHEKEQMLQGKVGKRTPEKSLPPQGRIDFEEEPQSTRTYTATSILEKPMIEIPSKDRAIANDDLIGEIKSMKKFMLQILTDQEEKLPPKLQQVNKLFSNQHVNNQTRSELLAKILLRSNNVSFNKQDLLNIAREELLLYLSSIKEDVNEDFSKIVCFVGPTGVGKTTTIAKLAADLILKHKKKVGFITTDTYRIAAVEQLKTYSNILHIPIEVVFSPEDLPSALEKLASCDTIMIDTAGRNYLQTMYIEELDTLLPRDENVQINLVLSLTAKIEDLNIIIDNFKRLEVDRLILTKLDETKSYGMIVNLLERYSYPLTYITNGQNVPDDILVATPDLITELILGEDSQ